MLALISALYVLAPVRTPPAVAVQEQLGAALDAAAHTARVAGAVRGAVVRDPELLRTATQGEAAFARAEDRALAADDVAAALAQSGHDRRNTAGARAWLDGVWVKIPTAPRPQQTQEPQQQGAHTE